ncbi:MULTISPECIES: hypothetical protein [Methylomonas]|uniref:hypothetical protein n=1 Tax=Methylomonas TaxID=416 RepID=UPI000AA8EC32|nr:hypothetical protein [Methylomonas koyamae]
MEDKAWYKVDREKTPPTNKNNDEKTIAYMIGRMIGIALIMTVTKFLVDLALGR